MSTFAAKQSKFENAKETLPPPLVEVKGLSVSFSRYTGPFRRELSAVVHGIDMHINPGEILAVVGESGAGKSLLASALLGVLPPGAVVSGEINYLGAPLDPEVRRGRDIHFVPQGVSAIDPTMTIGRFISRDGLPAAPRLEKFGLGEEFLDRYPHELSGGQLRRVLLATSLSEEVKLLVADEPTPGLHKAAVEQALDYFLELRDNGVAVLLITHDMVAAAEIADRIVVLKDGRKDSEFPVSQIPDLSEYASQLWRVQPANEFWDAV